MNTFFAVLLDFTAISQVSLLYHVNFWSKKTERLLRRVPFGIRMLNRDRMGVSIRSGDIYINDSKIVVQDIVTQNGVIHVIDAVLIPPSH